MSILPSIKNWIEKQFVALACLVLLVMLFVGVGYLHAVLSVGPNPYLSYQGRLSDQNGNLLTGNYYITFCIYASSSPATACTPPTTPSQGAIGVLSGSVLNSALWGDVEYFSATNSPDNHVVNGVFNAKLGSQSSFPATLFNANSQLWLGVNIYNGSSWDGQMTPLQEIVSSGYAINAGMLSGFSASQTPGANNVVVLDGSGNLTINTGTKNIFGASAASSTQYGLVDIGGGGFGGGAGNFAGSSNGTELAINAPTGFTGNLFDVQTAGVSALSLDSYGTLYNYGNLTLGSVANPTSAPTLSQTAGGALGAITYYVVYTWKNDNGQTRISPEASLAVSANNVLKVTIPSLPANASSAVIYVSNTAGGGSTHETSQATITTTTWTEPTSGLVVGSAYDFTNRTGSHLQLDDATGNTGSIEDRYGTFYLNVSGGNSFDFLNSNGLIVLAPGSSGNNSFNSETTGGASSPLTINSTTLTLTDNDNIFSAAANAGANYGVVNIGSGGFSGAAGNFSGSSSGTQLAINAPSGFGGNLVDIQTNGFSEAKIDATGNVMLGDGNITLNQLTNASTAPTLSVTNSGGSLAAGTWFGKYTWYNANGETLASSESTQATTTGGASKITFTIPSIPSGATGAKLYLTPVNGASGTEVYQNVTITSGTTGVVSAYNAGASGPAANHTGGEMTITGSKSIFSGPAGLTTSYGVVDIGSGGFSGSAGNFSGTSTGTQLAVNAASGFNGNLVDLQTNGSSMFKVDGAGNVVENNGNFTVNTVTNPAGTPTIANSGTGGTIAAGTYYACFTWVNGDGETECSPASSSTTASGSTSSITVTLPAGANGTLPQTVTSARVYLGTSNITGNMHLQTGSITVSNGNLVITAYNSGSTAPPVQNIAGGVMNATRVVLTGDQDNATGILLNNTNAGTLNNYSPIIDFRVNGFDRYIRSFGNTIVFMKTDTTTGDSFDNNGNITSTGNNNQFTSATYASSNFGTVNVGGGGFGGSAGNFAGAASGTELAINASSGFGGNIADFQKNGTSLFKLDNAGNLSLLTSAPGTSQYPLVALGAGGFSGGNGGFNGWGNGIYLGVNAVSGFAGNYLDFQVAGQSEYAIQSDGSVYEGGNLTDYSNLTLSQISAPSTPSTSCTSGGALTATTYYVKLTYVNGTGETTPSTEVSQACGANTVLNITFGEFWRGVTSANVYVSNTAGGGSGAETKQGSFTTSQGTWVEPTSGLVAGAAVPSSNTTGGGIYGSGFSLTNDKNGYIDWGVGSNTPLIVTTSTGGLLVYNPTSSPGGGRLFIQPGTSNGLNEIYSTNGAQSAVQNLTISGPSSIPVLTLDAISTVFTGNDNIFSSAANAGANYGVVNIGSGGFTGGTGKFAGSSNGTELAINAPSGFTGNLIDSQINGVSLFKVDNNGDIIVNAPNGYSGNLVNLQLNSTTIFRVDTKAHVTTGGTAPTPVAGPNPCTGATLTATSGSTDFAGQIEVTTGGSTCSGAIVQVNFANAFVSTPFVNLTYQSGNTAGTLYVWGVNTTSFTIAVTGTMAATTNYFFNYTVVQ